MKFQNKTTGMFQMIIAIVMISIYALPNAMAADQGATKQYLQKTYMDYLNSEGYQAKIDSDGDVRFKSEGRTFFIAIDEDDPLFLRIVLPNIWPIENNEEKLQVLIAADYTNRKIKAAKVFIAQGNTWAAIESFVADPENISAIFKRSLSALNGSAMQFAQKMRSKATMKQRSSSSMKLSLPESDASIGMI